MGQQIIQQPDGRYAIFSSSTDTIIMWDATEQEIVGWFVDRAVETARRDAQGVLGHVKAGNAREAYCHTSPPWPRSEATAVRCGRNGNDNHRATEEPRCVR